MFSVYSTSFSGIRAKYQRCIPFILRIRRVPRGWASTDHNHFMRWQHPFNPGKWINPMYPFNNYSSQENKLQIRETLIRQSKLLISSPDNLKHCKCCVLLCRAGSRFSTWFNTPGPLNPINYLYQFNFYIFIYLDKNISVYYMSRMHKNCVGKKMSE